MEAAVVKARGTMGREACRLEEERMVQEERWREVHRMAREEQLPITEIARRLDLDRKNVARQPSSLCFSACGRSRSGSPADPACRVGYRSKGTRSTAIPLGVSSLMRYTPGGAREPSGPRPSQSTS